MDAAFCLMSVAYVGIGFMYFMLHVLMVYIIYFCILIVWLTDTGAYIFGRLMGKHKLWPVISPNKTIEGFIGGLICSLIVPLVMMFCRFSSKYLAVIINYNDFKCIWSIR